MSLTDTEVCNILQRLGLKRGKHAAFFYVTCCRQFPGTQHVVQRKYLNGRVVLRCGRSQTKLNCC